MSENIPENRPEQPVDDTPPKPSDAQRRKQLRSPLNIVHLPPKPRFRAPPPARTQVLTGAYGTADYATIRHAHRAHEILDFQGVRYRVLAIRVEGKIFRAVVRETRKRVI